MRITQKYLRDRGACYTQSELESYVFKDHQWVNHTTILKDKDIKTTDKLWLILHPDFIEEKKLHLLACDYAEHVPQTKEALALIQSKRDWVAGKITDNELNKRRAAFSAVYWAYWAADRAADTVRLTGPASWAAYSAADSAEKEWQLEQAIKVMEEE